MRIFKDLAKIIEEYMNFIISSNPYVILICFPLSKLIFVLFLGKFMSKTDKRRFNQGILRKNNG